MRTFYSYKKFAITVLAVLFAASFMQSGTVAGNEASSAMAEVNKSQSADALRVATEKNFAALELDSTEYNQLDESGKNRVWENIYNRRSGGFGSAEELRNEFNKNIVYAKINARTEFFLRENEDYKKIVRIKRGAVKIVTTVDNGSQGAVHVAALYDAHSNLCEVAAADGGVSSEFTSYVTIPPNTQDYELCVYLFDNRTLKPYADVKRLDAVGSGESPTGEEILADMFQVHPVGGHPRILATSDDFERIKQLAETDETYKKLKDKIISDANSLLTARVSEYVIPDGIRLLSTSRTVLNRILTLAMAYNIADTNSYPYAQRAYREMEAVAAFPNWNSRHTLDTGEMCAALAIGYDWIYKWTTNKQKSILRKAISTMGLEEIMDDYENRPRSRTYDWSNSAVINNWRFVCNGGAALAALAIAGEDDDESVDKLCADVLGYGMKNLQGTMFLFQRGGAYEEGLSYWGYAVKYFTYHLAALESATGSDYGFSSYRGVRDTVYFPILLSGPAGVFNFHDAGQGWANDPSFFWLANKFGLPDAAGARYNYMHKRNVFGNAEDLLWYDIGKCDPNAVPPIDYGDVGTDNAVFRSGWDDNALFTGFHTGENNVSHAHLDMGTFVIDSQGQRFIMDLGQDDYNLPGDTFNRYRYRAEGHNTLVINPSAGYDQNRNAACLIDSYYVSPGEAFAISDISNAYTRKVIRGVKLTNDRTAVVVQDEIEAERGDVIWWFAHTDAKDIELSPDGKGAVLTKNGKKLQADIISGGNLKFEIKNAVRFETTPNIPGQNPNTGVRKLAICAEGEERLTISVAFTPLTGTGVTPPPFKAISDWESE